MLLALSPGPDNLFVLLHSAAHGPKTGLLIVLGLCTGLIVHTLAAAGGLAALSVRYLAAKQYSNPPPPVRRSASMLQPIEEWDEFQDLPAALSLIPLRS